MCVIQQLVGVKLTLPPFILPSGRLLDLLMFKKDALHFLLHEQADKLGLPIADRQTLRAALATPDAYRVRMGQPSFAALNSKESVPVPGENPFHYFQASE